MLRFRIGVSNAGSPAAEGYPKAERDNVTSLMHITT